MKMPAFSQLQREQLRSELFPPSPPTQNRQPPTPSRRVKITPRDRIDPDKLTPTQQAKWESGLFGSIQLRDRTDGSSYYILRWMDGKVHRSNYLADEWNDAIAESKKIILG